MAMSLFHAERAARFAALSPAANGQSVMPCMSSCDSFNTTPIHAAGRAHNSLVVRQLFRAHWQFACNFHTFRHVQLCRLTTSAI